MAIISKKIVIGQKSLHLESFLSCTLNERSPANKLRGNTHVLKYIWTLVCEEWWDLHIARFPRTGDILDLTLPWKRRDPATGQDVVSQEDNRQYPHSRLMCAGCPVAMIATNLGFPLPSVVPPGTFANQESEYLYVNMLPFKPRDLGTIPPACRGYLPMIEACLKMCNGRRSVLLECVYLTIDERPTSAGSSQRRPGLHVESPGVLPVEQVGVSLEDAPFSIAVPGGRFMPGVEHRWGRGMMTRDEMVEGGIFMASNIAGTTAVWNCQVNNDHGAFVGPHGDIEHLRPLLGPCARTLEAGELVWMTDRTPHESLPVPTTAVGTRRQYFRLVVGTVSAWFADHSTPNPLGCLPHPSTRIVKGDKFALAAQAGMHFSWHCGTVTQLAAAREFQALQDLMFEHGLGHCIKRFHDCGIVNIRRLYESEYSEGMGTILFETFGALFCRSKRMIQFLKAGRDLLDTEVLCGRKRKAD